MVRRGSRNTGFYKYTTLVAEAETEIHRSIVGRQARVSQMGETHPASLHEYLSVEKIARYGASSPTTRASCGKNRATLNRR